MANPTILITGIHTGLGKALAQSLLDQGADVFGISRQPPEELSTNPRLHFLSLDLSHTEEICDAVREFLRPVQKLDLVVLNAGVLGEIKDLRDTSLSELAHVMNINVWANKLIYDVLLDLGITIPQLVAISSGAAFNGSGGWGAYSISKSALNLMFRVYADEHPETHITCLSPGLVQTQMLDYVFSLASDERYPAIERLRSARGTEKLLSPTEASEKLLAALPRLLEYKSGSFVHLREM
jgi:benzil reductase ((S)-benzoin forming)